MSPNIRAKIATMFLTFSQLFSQTYEWKLSVYEWKLLACHVESGKLDNY